MVALEELERQWESILNKRVVTLLKSRIEESRVYFQMNLIAMLD